jgi:hypothetical protein
MSDLADITPHGQIIHKEFKEIIIFNGIFELMNLTRRSYEISRVTEERTSSRSMYSSHSDLQGTGSIKVNS